MQRGENKMAFERTIHTRALHVLPREASSGIVNTLAKI
jgi:hypothetical protein